MVEAAKQAAVPDRAAWLEAPASAGGAVPAEGGIVLSLRTTQSNLKIDLENRIAIVEPGVINPRRDEGRRQRRPFLRARTRAVRRHVRSAATWRTIPAGPHARLRRHYQSRTRPRSRARRRRHCLARRRSAPTPRVTIFARIFVGSRKEPLGVVTKVRGETDANPRVGAHVTLAIFDEMDNADSDRCRHYRRPASFRRSVGNDGSHNDRGPSSAARRWAFRAMRKRC
mgnify:CR=1 FL=1